MATITTTQSFTTGDQVTAATLNAIATGSAFDTSVVDDSSTALTTNASGTANSRIIVKDSGVSTAKIADSAVTTEKIADSAITSAKLSLTDGATVSKTGTSQTITSFNTTQGGSSRGIRIKTPVDSDANSPFAIATANAISFEIDDTEAVRIDHTGKLLVGLTSSPTSVAGSISCAGRIVTQGTYSETTSASANLVVTTSGFLARSTSSFRYKENIQDYDKGIEAIKALRPVTYQSKNEDDDKTYAGFIAEEVHDAGLSEFVDYNPECQPDALHYANMTAVLTKALQEALTKIESLEARVAALES